MELPGRAFDDDVAGQRPYKTLDDVHQSAHDKSIAQHQNTMSTDLDERFPHTDANIREVAPGVWTISAYAPRPDLCIHG
jgi:hypothetical protein